MRHPSASVSSDGSDDDLLRNWMDHCTLMKGLHAKRGSMYTWLNTSYIILVVCLGLVAGFTNIVVTTYTESEPGFNSVPYTIFTGLLSLLSTALTAAHNGISVSKKTWEHNACSLKYADIARDICTELELRDLQSSQFKSLGAFIIYIKGEIDSVDDSAPPL